MKMYFIIEIINEHIFRVHFVIHLELLQRSIVYGILQL